MSLSSAVVTNMSYTVNFCPFEVGACPMIVGKVNADGNGNGSANFQFPQKGTFAGVFRVLSDDDRFWLYSGMVPGSSLRQVFHLVKSANVTPLPPSWAPLGSDPLQWGAITVDASGAIPKATLELHGAAPNMEYGIVECDAKPEDSPVCTSVMGSFMTDATGSATVPFTPANTNPAIYEVKHGDLHEFVTGFVVE